MDKLLGIRNLSNRLIQGQKNAQRTIIIILKYKEKKKTQDILALLDVLWEDNLIQGYTKDYKKGFLVLKINLKYINSIRSPLIKSINVIKMSKSSKLKKKFLLKIYMGKDRKVIYMSHKNSFKKESKTNIEDWTTFSSAHFIIINFG